MECTMIVMDYVSGHTRETDTVGGVVVKSCLGRMFGS